MKFAFSKNNVNGGAHITEILLSYLQFTSVAQLCLTLCDPMDCSTPSSSVYGILQTRTLEKIAMLSSREIDPEIESGSHTLQADSYCLIH